MTGVSAPVVRDRASPMGGDHDDGLAEVASTDDSLQGMRGAA